jgi:hypothetical protein
MCYLERLAADAKRLQDYMRCNPEDCERIHNPQTIQEILERRQRRQQTLSDLLKELEEVRIVVFRLRQQLLTDAVLRGH